MDSGKPAVGLVSSIKNALAASISPGVLDPPPARGPPALPLSRAVTVSEDSDYSAPEYKIACAVVVREATRMENAATAMRRRLQVVTAGWTPNRTSTGTEVTTNRSPDRLGSLPVVEIMPSRSESAQANGESNLPVNVKFKLNTEPFNVKLHWHSGCQ